MAKLTRVFSLNFWWGWGDSKFSVPVGPGWGRSRMGGNLQKKSDWSQNCPLNAKLGLFCYLKHEIQLFKVLLSLKVVKFDTKMYLNFSNFRGQTLAGGDKPWSKNGDKCRMGGGDWQNFRRIPPVPPRKKPCWLPFHIPKTTLLCMPIYVHFLYCLNDIFDFYKHSFLINHFLSYLWIGCRNIYPIKDSSDSRLRSPNWKWRTPQWIRQRKWWWGLWENYDMWGTR